MAFQRQQVRTFTHYYMRFILAMGRSLGFGSTPRNFVARLGLAFATAPSLKDLTSLRRVTRRFIMQKARGHTVNESKPTHMVLPLLVGIGFQVLFHSPSGVLFTFPSRYLCTIGHRIVFSLRRWSSRIPTGFHVSRSTWVSGQERSYAFRLRAYYPLWMAFPYQFG
jgi:hypothetical protein